MRLALFDLDHTLLPGDSGMMWLHFLVVRGALGPDAKADADYLAQCRRHVAGELDIEGLHRALMAPLRGLSRAELLYWLDEFETDLAGRLPAAARRLVARHLGAGDLCCLVTATSRPIAERAARAFGLGHVLATEPALDAHGIPTGAIVGPPCHGAHKLARVQGWLTGYGVPLERLERSSFYSDSASDLPLLRAVSHPVAVRPDARLRAVAEADGWPIEALAG